MNSLARFYTLCLLFFVSATAFAQDAHYWTEQFGTRSMLLSNSVVGSVDDLGAVYYNPARLSLIENAAFVISGKVYQHSTTKYNDITGNGPGASKKSSSFGGAPSLVAGTYSIKGAEKHTFAYAFLRRKGMDVDLDASSEIFGDVMESIPGEEYFSGNMSLGKKFNEEWMGASWSYAFNSNMSIGVTNFLSIRDQKAHLQTQLQAYSEEGKVESYFAKRSYDYNTVGILWKIGLAMNYDPFNFGLTVTTPTIQIKGSGSFHYEQVYTGIYGNQPIYERATQSDIDMTYRTPFSVAGGFGVKLFKGVLHGSAEYYHSVNQYTLMDADPFVGQSTNIEIDPFLKDELNSVFNYGLGYNFQFSEKINGYISYAADYSAAPDYQKNDGQNNGLVYASTFHSKINHYAGGVMLNFKRADITLGASLATTDYEISRPIHFPDGDDIKLLNPDQKSQIHWNRLRFIIGISIPMFDNFLKKMEDKITG
ncbi:hypothetical protein E9993_22270 [Labilibacter sediminis]|nr:hypothetical protein E9993_22270 [Labilibacter sediminis]